MRSLLVLLVLTAAASSARADATTDVTKAFGAFAASVGTDKPALAGVEMFVPPYATDEALPTADDLATLRKLVPAGKLSAVKVVVAPSGSSAWLVAQIAARVPHMQVNGLPRTDDENLRANALLVRDDAGWHVRATHWSVAVPNRTIPNCGAINYYWTPAHAVPPALEATVTALYAAFDAGKPGSAATIMSDDKAAIAVGSAPGELFSGGAAIQAVFKKWPIFAERGDESKPAPVRAGISPGGDLMWIAVPIGSPPAQCTMYRALFVLQKEKAGWRVVDQHYSEHFAIE